jgi:hypothetical protein
MVREETSRTVRCSNERFLWWALRACIECALVIAVVSCSRSSSTSKVVRDADARMHRAFLEYAHGSFDSASNALKEFTAFLDVNEKRISSYRDYDAVDLNGKKVPFPVSRNVPVTQFTPHSMLACMMIYSGNTNEALRHLSRAYNYHVQIFTHAQRKPVSRAQFVEFILDGRDKIDSKTGAEWKSHFTVDTNIVDGIVSAWIERNHSE